MWGQMSVEVAEENPQGRKRQKEKRKDRERKVVSVAFNTLTVDSFQFGRN